MLRPLSWQDCCRAWAISVLIELTIARSIALWRNSTNSGVIVNGGNSRGIVPVIELRRSGVLPFSFKSTAHEIEEIAHQPAIQKGNGSRKDDRTQREKHRQP